MESFTLKWVRVPHENKLSLALPRVVVPDTVRADRIREKQPRGSYPLSISFHSEKVTYASLGTKFHSWEYNGVNYPKKVGTRDVPI